FTKNYDIFHSRRFGAKSPFSGPTPILAVCTVAQELHPWVNGSEFYFSRRTKEGWRLFVARRSPEGAISDPKEVDLPPGFHHATLSNDGLTMYLQGPLEQAG